MGLRDRIALRLLLDYALRKSALRSIQINHFDYERHRLIIFTKGKKVREIPIPDPAFWTDLEHYILESEATPSSYLMAKAPAATERSTRRSRWDHTDYTTGGTDAL